MIYLINKLFLGVCTLFSVHKVKYLYHFNESIGENIKECTKSKEVDCTNHQWKSLNLSDVVRLPINHHLRKMANKTLNDQGYIPDTISMADSWLIEDYESPGLHLLLKCIDSIDCGFVPKIVDLAKRLTCLLHDNWSAYEK